MSAQLPASLRILFVRHRRHHTFNFPARLKVSHSCLRFDVNPHRPNLAVLLVITAGILLFIPSNEVAASKLALSTTTSIRLQCAPWDGAALGIKTEFGMLGSPMQTLHLTIWGRGFRDLLKGAKHLVIDGIMDHRGTGQTTLCEKDGDPCAAALVSRLEVEDVALKPGGTFVGTLNFKMLEAGSEIAVPINGHIEAQLDECG